MSSRSDRVSLSDSGSEQSRDNRSSRDDTSDREERGSIGGIPMERVVEVREDLPEELAKSDWPAKSGYKWVAADVRTQRSLFWWSRLLRSWLNCTPIFEKGGAKGHNCSGAGYRCGMCMPWSRRSSRRILLHVHVPFLAAAHSAIV